MDRVSIRDLSGDVIRRHAIEQDILGVTSKGALLGVLVPLTPEIHQRLAMSEAHDPSAADDGTGSDVGLSDLRDVLQDEAPPPGRPNDFSRVSIREISGARLEQASSDGTPLVVTSGRLAVAVFLPLASGWVDQLVEESIKRFMAGQLPHRSVPSLDAENAFRGIGSTRTPARRLTDIRAIGIRIVEDALVEHKRIVGVVTDGLAETKGEKITLPLDQLDPGYVFDQILTLVGQLESRIPDPEKLVGIGVELGGHVHRGRVVRSANIAWNQFPLAAHLHEETGIPVVLENDANALAIHEQWQGISADNFAVVLLTNLGVGCGLILDGSLYRGKHGMAAEIGHLPIEATGPDAALCRCGSRGCLERVAPPRAIMTALHDRGFSGNYRQALKAVDDPRVRDVFEHAGAALGKGIATVLNLLNPETVVLYAPLEIVGRTGEFHIADRGSVTEGEGVHRIYMEAMANSIRGHVFSTAGSDCNFVIRERSDEKAASAAATCAIHESRASAVTSGRGIVSAPA